MKTKLIFATLILLFFFVLHPSAFSQGSLTPPPGAPAPTMKTLEQIEPRIEVNATNTPGNGANLFVISAPGSYYLSANVAGVSGKNGINISGNDVTLDLNGFVLTGVPGSLAGIYVIGGRNIAIRNGTIRNWGAEGVNSVFILYSVLEDLRLYKNGSVGLEANGGSIVRRCVASYNAGAGFDLGAKTTGNEVAAGVVVENCFATGNGGNGFALEGAAITHCEAGYNSGNGINASAASTITHCLTSANLGDGINAAAGSTLTNCAARDNGGTYGIFVGEGSTLTGCTASSNDVEHGIHADLRSTLTNCTASGNDSAATDSWGISVGAQSTVSNCTSTANTNSNGTASDSTGGGILAGQSSTVQNCTVVGNKGDGIQIAGDSRVMGNNCDSNEFGGGNAAGIHSTSADNRIEGNNVTDNTRGIQVDSSGSLIIKNSSSGSTGPGPAPAPHYVIAGGNSFGPVVNVAGVGDIVGTPNANHPWANFSY